jgi:hypothetical protein
MAPELCSQDNTEGNHECSEGEAEAMSETPAAEWNSHGAER